MYFIGFLFGNAYNGAYDALVFNIWAGAFISQGMARGIWMVNENLQKYRLFNNILAITTNILLNMWLIPKLGITGAAIATLISQSIGIFIFSFFWSPLRSSTLDMIKSMNPFYILSLRRCRK